MKIFFYRLFFIFLLPLLALGSSSGAKAACISKLPTKVQDFDANSASINLMWISRVRNLERQYVLNPEFSPKIINWANAFFKSKINVWYDARLVSKAAVSATTEELRQGSGNDSISRRIQLRDIWEIVRVRENEDVFDENLVVYFRVDLLRPIIALYMLCATKETDYFVYADLDIDPPHPEVLFSEKNLNTIGDSGILMAKLPLSENESSIANTVYLNYENGLQVISNHSKALIHAMDTAVIRVNIERARNALKGTFACSSPSPMKALTEAVYHSYQNMFKYMACLRGHGKLYVIRPTEEHPSAQQKQTKKGMVSLAAYTKGMYVVEEYDEMKHGLIPFNLTCEGDGIGLAFVPKILCPLAHKVSAHDAKRLMNDIMLAPVVEGVELPRSIISDYVDPLYKKKIPQPAVNGQNILKKE